MTGILIVDKPEGWTSQDVCAKLRGVLGERRVGHGGTLDPMATGVLPVFVGRATRAASFSENARKRYTAALRPGLTTDTQDTTGTVLEEKAVSLTREALEAVLPAFTGPQEQLPPMYSAVKIGGKKLYELARRGEEAQRTPRPITIFSLTLLGEENGDFLLDVTCSKGTYIRTLVHDIGQALGCGAAMSALRRTEAGAFSLRDAVPLRTLVEAGPEGAEACLRPVDSLFSSLPACTVRDKALRLALNGNTFRAGLPDGRCRIYAEDGAFLLLGDCKDGVVTTVKSFF